MFDIFKLITIFWASSTCDQKYCNCRDKQNRAVTRKVFMKQRNVQGLKNFHKICARARKYQFFLNCTWYIFKLCKWNSRNSVFFLRNMELEKKYSRDTSEQTPKILWKPPENLMPPVALRSHTSDYFCRGAFILFSLLWTTLRGDRHGPRSAHI